MRKFHLFISLCLLSALTASAQLEWKSIGYATVVDGWITPGYVDDNGKQIDPNTCPFEVAVEESIDYPGMYKLVNPFGGKDFHLSEFNLDGTACDIIIDARDYTFVIIQPQYCGFTDADDSQPSGQYPYYISDMGTYMYNMGQQREVINVLKCAATRAGNTIYIPQPTMGTTCDHAIEAWDPSYPAIITLPDGFEADAANWEVIGTATLADGWILPGWDDDNGNSLVPEEHPVACEVAMNQDNPNLIAIISPFRNPDYELYTENLSASNVRIVFDVTDPEFVTMQPQFSGFIARRDNDIMPFFITDGGTYLLANGRTREQVIAGGHNATYVDNVITIPSPLWGTAIDDTGKIWNNYKASVITIGQGGKHDIAVDYNEGEVHFFNLQGVEITNPQHGQIYIRRSGSTATKVRF